MRAYESAFKVQLTMLDWDKLSSNDHVGDAGFMEADLMADTPRRDEGTALYGEEADGGHEWEGCCAVGGETRSCYYLPVSP